MEEATGDVEILQEVARVLERARELEESAASLISKVRNEEQSLCKQALSLDSEIRQLKRSVEDAAMNGAIDPAVVEKVEEELYKAHCLMSDGDVSSFLPVKSNGRFLRMFLGPINVRATRKDVQLKVKEEYNSYKDRAAILFLLFPCILLFLRNQMWIGCFPVLPFQLYQVWLLFFYASLALRENILRVNGSDIRPWWIYHHYCAMVMALISLTWEIKGEPDCAQKQRAVLLFLAWAIMQGVAMLLQNRYQRQRMYTRIALGKIFEAYLGILLLRTAFSGVVSEWQVVACGSLLVVMAAGNFANTIQTLGAKARVKANKLKRSKSKQELSPSKSGKAA